MTRWMLVSMRSISSAARRGWIDLSWDVATTRQSSGAFPDRAPETLRYPPRRNPGLTSALDVAQLFGDLAVSDLEQVDTAHVAFAPVESPAHDGAVAGHDQLLRFESCLRRAGEEGFPESAHVRLPDMPLPVRWRQRVFEDAVVGHQRHHRVDVMAAERFVESLDRLLGVQRPSSGRPCAR